LGILVGILGISVLLWYERYSPWAEKYPDPRIARVVLSEPVAGRKAREAREARQERPNSQHVAEKASPQAERPPRAKPPFPQAVVAERIYHFGTLEVGKEQIHAFRIENKGKGPLILIKAPALDIPPWKREVPPGGSVDFDVHFRPTESTPHFTQRTILWTNDPQQPDIQFEVDGRLIAPVRIEPASEWNVPTMRGDKDGKFTGRIGSDTEASFRIVSVESPNSFVTVAHRPLTPGELSRDGMRSGYTFDVTLSKDIPEGVFQSELTIHTTLPQGETIKVKVTSLQLR
jgi:hypothetical protein